MDQRIEGAGRDPVALIIVGSMVGFLVLFAGFVFLGASDDAPADSQEDFLRIVGGARAAAEGDNEVRIAEARKQRARELCDLLPESLAVSGWTGTVQDISTTLGGDAGVLSVSLSEDIELTTANNSFSDGANETLISEDSELYGVVSALDPGETVTFSGSFISGDECVRELSLLDENGIETPDFLFRFTSITAD